MNYCSNYFLQLLSKNSNRSPTTGTQSKLWSCRTCTFWISAYKYSLDTRNIGCIWSHQKTQGWQCMRSCFFFPFIHKSLKGEFRVIILIFFLFHKEIHVSLNVKLASYSDYCNLLQSSLEVRPLGLNCLLIFYIIDVFNTLSSLLWFVRASFKKSVRKGLKRMVYPCLCPYSNILYFFTIFWLAYWWLLEDLT